MSFIALVLRTPLINIYYFICDYVLNKWRHFKIRLVVRLSGGSIKIGKNVKFNHRVICQGRGRIVIEDNVVFGYRLAGSIDNSIILQVRAPESSILILEYAQIMNGVEVFSTKSIKVGRKTLLGANVKLMDSDFHAVNPMLRSSPGLSSPIDIGDNVWIGMGVMILKGTNIGHNSVVGAGSLITKNIPPNTLNAGFPCKVIRDI